MFNFVSKADLEVLAEIPTLRATNLNIGNKVLALTVDNFEVKLPLEQLEPLKTLKPEL